MHSEDDAKRTKRAVARSEDRFSVRATGDSMNGGNDPICDGDWLVFRYARGAGLGAVEGGWR